MIGAVTEEKVFVFFLFFFFHFAQSLNLPVLKMGCPFSKLKFGNAETQLHVYIDENTI